VDLTAALLQESAISGEEFRSTIRRWVHGVFNTIGGVLRGHDLMTPGISFSSSDQGPATPCKKSIVADGCEQ
jgi:hypothetical protein